MVIFLAPHIRQRRAFTLPEHVSYLETYTPAGIFQFKIFSTSLQTARVICLLVVFDLSRSYFRCSCKYRVTALPE